MHTTPGQRHAPTVNKQGTKEEVYHSLELMAICHHATNALTKEQCNNLFYFNKAM